MFFVSHIVTLVFIFASLVNSSSHSDDGIKCQCDDVTGNISPILAIKSGPLEIQIKFVEEGAPLLEGFLSIDELNTGVHALFGKIPSLLDAVPELFEKFNSFELEGSQKVSFKLLVNSVPIDLIEMLNTVSNAASATSSSPPECLDSNLEESSGMPKDLKDEISFIFGSSDFSSISDLVFYSLEGNTAVSEELKQLCPFNVEELMTDKNGKQCARLSLSLMARDTVKAFVMIAIGANYEIFDGYGHAAIHTAAITHNLTMIKFLLWKGVDINIPSLNGSTPLHHACAGFCLETVKFLLDHGANCEALDNSGNTPMELAKLVNRVEIVEFLSSKQE